MQRLILRHSKSGIPGGIPPLHIWRKIRKNHCLDWQLPQQPVQPAHLPEQLPPSGQPIHFCPFFLARMMYHTAPPKMAARTTIRITFSIGTPYFLPLSAYSAFKAFSERTHSHTRTAAKAATKISPPRKPAPRAPVVIKVPIW